MRSQRLLDRLGLAEAVRLGMMASLPLRAWAFTSAIAAIRSSGLGPASPGESDAIYPLVEKMCC